MLLGGVAGGVYQPQHESSAAASPITTTSSNTTATTACSVQVRYVIRWIDYKRMILIELINYKILFHLTYKNMITKCLGYKF